MMQDFVINILDRFGHRKSDIEIDFDYSKSFQENADTLYRTIGRLYDMYKKDMLILAGKEQKLYLVNLDENTLLIKRESSISTGENGFGNERDSQKTPTGLHRIKYKYGDNADYGAIFEYKKNIGRVANIIPAGVLLLHSGPAALMTSRLLQLDGMENKNRNTLSRAIYLHGTNREDQLGLQASHGCIRMNNRDIIELYDIVSIGNYVYIVENL